MEHGKRRDVAVFDRDASTHGGYLYTTSDKLSTQLAIRRMLDAILGMRGFGGLRVLDIGCGDGFLSRQYHERGHPDRLVGMDPAPSAVKVARDRTSGTTARFLVGNGHHLPFATDSFDLAVLMGVLHHDDAPATTIREALRVARELIVLEPNGYNPGLKVIERVSPYHREHGEKSYPARRLRRWIAAGGGEVVSQEFAGLVPIFCPDVIARACKLAEPIVERAPVANALGCAYWVGLARRRTPAARVTGTPDHTATASIPRRPAVGR